MRSSAPLLTVPFREVRHFQPDDVLHYEAIEVRGRLHQWNIPAHRHQDIHQFNLLTGGAVTLSIDGTAYPLKAPAAWMVAPPTVHGLVYKERSAGHVVSVPSPAILNIKSNSPELTRALQHNIAASLRVGGRDVRDLRELFAQIGAEYAVQNPGRNEALGARTVLLALWFARRPDNLITTAVEPARPDVLVDRYRQLVDSNFRKNWPVRAYAAALQVTPDYLSRRCRAETGRGALDLAHERSLLEARRLLAYTSMTIADVAHELGHDDPSYFSKIFTKAIGQTPSSYRQAIARGLAAVPPATGIKY
jgi:AraC family transcriptional regulator, transcriptional activator of pobA